MTLKVSGILESLFVSMSLATYTWDMLIRPAYYRILALSPYG